MFKTVVPKLVRAVIPNQGIDCLITLNKHFSHFRSKISFAVIAHNTEQQSGFGFVSSPEELHITPGGSLPPVWEPQA